MELDTSVIIDLWELISDNVANNKKDDLATKLVSILAKEGVEKREFNTIRGEDDHLDSAVDNYFSDEEDEYSSAYDEDLDE
jgi:hypothetical protein